MVGLMGNNIYCTTLEFPSVFHHATIFIIVHYRCKISLISTLENIVHRVLLMSLFTHPSQHKIKLTVLQHSDQTLRRMSSMQCQLAKSRNRSSRPPICKRGKLYKKVTLWYRLLFDTALLQIMLAFKMHKTIVTFTPNVKQIYSLTSCMISMAICSVRRN